MDVHGTDDANASIAVDRPDFVTLLAHQMSGAEPLADDRMTIDGNTPALRIFGGLFDAFECWFRIVTP